MRHSQEWVKGGWKELSERADVAASILSGLVKEGRFGKQDSYQHLQTLVSKHPEYDVGKGYSCWTKDCSNKLRIDTWYKKAKNSTVTDLSKDDYLSQLKWESSCKRKRSGFVVPKLQPRRRLSSEINHEKRSSCEKYQEFLTPSTLKVEKERRNSVKVDLDNCKYITDALFTPSVVPSLTSLVMSR